MYKQQLDIIHKLVESHIDETGVDPLPDVPAINLGSDAGEQLSSSLKKQLLPPVDFNELELSLVPLLNAEGGLESEASAKTFVAILRQERVDEHKSLFVSIMKNTKLSAAQSIFLTAEILKCVASWLKV